MHISQKIIDLVIAQQTGTPIRTADDKRLNAMWNEVIGLLDIRIDESGVDDHRAQMKIMSLWVRREYPDLTCESVRRAYNLAVKGELDIDKVIPRIAPIYVGAVLKAFRRYLSEDMEYVRVHQQQLLRETDTEITTAQIDQQMQQYLREAIEMVRAGEDYPDVGNGLFTWLREQRRINPTTNEQKCYMDRAIPQVKALIASEKESTESSTPGGISKRKWLTEILKRDVLRDQYHPEFVSRVQAYAKYLYLNDYLKTLL